MAHLTNFSLGFFYEIFHRSLYFFYTMVQTSQKWQKTQIKGLALKLQFYSLMFFFVKVRFLSNLTTTTVMQGKRAAWRAGFEASKKSVLLHWSSASVAAGAVDDVQSLVASWVDLAGKSTWRLCVSTSFVLSSSPETNRSEAVRFLGGAHFKEAGRLRC